MAQKKSVLPEGDPVPEGVERAGQTFRSKLPGYIATGILAAVTAAWTFWGVMEVFHEGWYRPFEWLFFFLPALACLLLGLLALTWPRVGGWLLIVGGGGFFVFELIVAGRRTQLRLGPALALFAVSGVFAIVGVFFMLEDRRRRRDDTPADPRWWRRNLRYLVFVGVPLVLGIVLAVEPAIRVANRLDDGDRGARLIEGNGVTLVWAPAGPGWESSSHTLSWNQIALYGLPPVGVEGKKEGRDGLCDKDSTAGCATSEDMARYNLCRYLSEDGTTLREQPQDIWRMPTTDELVRSLVRHGQSAGCAWDGVLGHQLCDVDPDKETPLWIPGEPAIYYWSAEEEDMAYAYKVAYNSGVDALLKYSALGSCGFRCVREP